MIRSCCPGYTFALVGDLTGVDRVVQHLVKVAARERQPAAESAAILMALGDQPEVIGFLFEKVDAAQLQVAGKHLPEHPASDPLTTSFLSRLS